MKLNKDTEAILGRQCQDIGYPWFVVCFFIVKLMINWTRASRHFAP